ncbi:MAG: hypothetical protein ACYDCK_11195 [Thermoplasmatota archaeon]
MATADFVPLAGIAMVVALVAIIMYYRNERVKHESTGGGDYRRLAESAVASQKILLDEIQKMNATLHEIERLLREV